MSDLLSQDEIDSLLSSVAQEDSADPAAAADGAAPAGAETKAVAKHDFRKPSRMSSGQLRTLQILHDGYASRLSVALSSLLMTTVDARLVTLDEMAYDEYSAQLTEHGCTNVLTVSGREHKALLDVHPTLAFAIIEKLLGGGAAAIETERSLTGLEVSILKRALAVLVQELKEAWAPYSQVEFAVENTRTGTDGDPIADPQDSVIRGTLEIAMGSATGTIGICLPFDLLADLIPYAAAPEGEQALLEERAMTLTRSNMLGAQLPLQANLGGAVLTVRELLQLRAGDVIRLDVRQGAESVVTVQGKPKFRGQPGLVGKRIAVLVTHAGTPRPQAVAEEAEQAMQ